MANSKLSSFAPHDILDLQLTCSSDLPEPSTLTFVAPPAQMYNNMPAAEAFPKSPAQGFPAPHQTFAAPSAQGFSALHQTPTQIYLLRTRRRMKQKGKQGYLPRKDSDTTLLSALTFLHKRPSNVNIAHIVTQQRGRNAIRSSCLCFNNMSMAYK